MTDFNISDTNLSGLGARIFDYPRTGTFVSGFQTLYFWGTYRHVPASVTWRARLQRPNGTIAVSAGRRTHSNPYYRGAWWWLGFNVNLDQVGTWQAQVDLGLTGHPYAVVLGYESAASQVLAAGQVLLVGGAPIFELPLVPGPVATWTAAIPSDTALIGITIYTQAGHLLGSKPFALSNAQDLTLGY